ncbi:tyrosine-type recombinase/integrase [Glaciecola sp. SC05]|uniref:tyrosine-type recombinase/integrase n=1 Tax=Glaciecola sp. SC05 TaxID=1987355 RepID=UPI003526F297
MEKNCDYEIKVVKVLKNPKLASPTNLETCNLEQVIKGSATKRQKLSIIVQPDGMPLEPHNQYLHSKIKNGVMDTSSDAHALMSFQRFLTRIGETYQSLTDDPQEGVVWKYADYLIDNTKVFCPSSGGVLKNSHGYSSSTTNNYITVVIDFYKWLHSNGLFFITRDKKPFEFKEINKRMSKGINQHDLLGHISSRNRVLHIQTTDVKQRFPKIQSRQPHQILKPMTEEHKEIFHTHLKSLPYTYSNRTQSLMLRLAVETGLRMDEMVTFPALGIHHPTSEAESIPFSIGPYNGCNTKFRKVRNIKIPYGLMLALHEYLNSDDRKEMLKKRIGNLKKQHEKDVVAQKEIHIINGGTEDTFEGVEFDKIKHQEVQNLFVNTSGLPFNKNTLQSKFSDIRAAIQESHPIWYYRPHDLRSTFATHWLKREADRRVTVFDILISELADLMGHESTQITQKYINFMSDLTAKIEFARRKNRASQEAMIINKNIGL